jgi:hypothetical protein
MHFDECQEGDVRARPVEEGSVSYPVIFMETLRRGEDARDEKAAQSFRGKAILPAESEGLECWGAGVRIIARF